MIALFIRRFFVRILATLVAVFILKRGWIVVYVANFSSKLVSRSITPSIRRRQSPATMGHLLCELPIDDQVACHRRNSLWRLMDAWLIDWAGWALRHYLIGAVERSCASLTAPRPPLIIEAQLAWVILQIVGQCRVMLDFWRQNNRSDVRSLIVLSSIKGINIWLLKQGASIDNSVGWTNLLFRLTLLNGSLK